MIVYANECLTDVFTDDIDSSSSLSRSKTMPTLMRPKLTRKITNLQNSDRLKNAKELAEKAIKVSILISVHAIFTLSVPTDIPVQKYRPSSNSAKHGI